jgi:16S rRNA (uracil1498-N3)-methyltransferase
LSARYPKTVEMQRFFVARDKLNDGAVEFTEEQAHQIARVLRLRVGDEVAVLDNGGWIYQVELTATLPTSARGLVRRRHLAPGEPRTKLTLYPALLKSDKLEFVLQKCTELGVSAFAPVVSDRCNVSGSASEERLGRWERIISEAAEQCERGRLPQLLPVAFFETACEQARGLSFIACERGDRPSLCVEIANRLGRKSQRPFAMNLFVGPEGGYTDAELAGAIGRGIIPVGLGPRILRAETASIVGAALLLAYAGDLE